ncbi:serine/threonine protein kinase [Streptomyces scopuliridis]|uniref:Serine/threonine protein kinase n=1 Tax=Streptomyces scopuliridis TaxID=452529 RepID=A0ACD4ZTM0_9ACTN|nr:serine/threonine-protein kinase [Streptomyces scopuliridis]WSC01739.1 serine/threonine protein kinase [Streptomyces scopuliridis]WSC04722.1 serine/threonine protein kinase [Streptomyces scopuliridis]
MTGSPTQIGRYTVARELGSGGMGEVYLAYSPAGSPVAVKVIRTDKLDPITRARFEKEALIARTVIGTNRVARFLDADPFADRPWLAMEYVAGRTLLDCVDSDGALPLPLAASLGALLAEGLSAVHDAGLLHRDLKPQNVMLGSEGPIIIDFGLSAFMDSAKDTLSHSGMIIGTVRCMPPEQASGHPQVTPAADVYALGTVLLYAAARHYPYDGHQWEAVAMQVSNPEIGPDLSGVPEGFKELLAAMLAHTPEGRPSLAEVADTCADLMKAAGRTPADARLALIDRTTASGGNAPAQEPSSPSIEKLIDEQAAIVDPRNLVSPLDLRPAIEEPEADEEPLPELPTVPMRPKGRTSRERPVASKRVAGELREQYAVNATL